jgi:hypothetical protein
MPFALRALVLPWLAGCGSPSTPPGELPTLSVGECESRGVLVGDIGDGRTQQPDFLCPDGQRPIGRVALGIEGSVCCASGGGR